MRGHPGTTERTTRQPAVGRFRAERLAREEQNFADRIAAAIAAAEAVGTLSLASRATLAQIRTDRAEARVTNSGAREAAHRALRSSTQTMLADARGTRHAQATKDRAKRQHAVQVLRDDVVSIVSSDFGAG